MAGIALLVGIVGCRGGASAPSPTTPIAQGSCPEDAVCFNVVSGAPGALGPVRLLLMWVRPDHDDDPSPDVIELGSLAGQERSVSVRRSTLRPPTRIGAYGVTWGYLFAVPADANAATTSPKEAVGIAQMMFTDAKPEVTQLPVNKTYPAGLAPGIAAYRMARVEGGSHDKFFLAPTGAVFDLVICPAVQPRCRLRAPNPN
jgi:hypothetical protein